jgi:hypothetical protein
MEKDLKEVKEQLLMGIEGKASWRGFLSSRYSDDKRNVWSSEALEKLYEYLNKLPEDHPIFERFWSMDDNEIQDFKYRISRYGFGDWIENPETFISEEMMTGLYKFNEN